MYSYDVDADIAAGRAPDASKHTGRQSGFIAQEILRDVPELGRVVSTAYDGFYVVNYISLVPELVSAVQELDNRCALKDAQIAALAARVDALEGRGL